MTQLLKLWRYWLPALAFLCALAAVPADARDSKNADDPREEAQKLEKVAERNTAPWYSSKEKRLRYLPLKKVKERPERKTPMFEFPEVGQIFQDLYYVIGTIACVALACLILWIVRHVWKKAALARKPQEDPAARARRLNALTEESAQRYDDLLNAATDALTRGDLRAATIFYFSWLLVEMDKREFVYLDKGKTNLEYWRELEGVDELRAIYRTTMRVFENTYFGAVPLSREEFDKIWALRPRFEEILRKKDAELEARLAPNANIVKLALICALGASCALSGCKREPTWRPEYDAPGYQKYRKSLNSRYLFQRYCVSERKWKERRDDWGLVKNSPDLDAVFWFDNSGGRGTRYNLTLTHWETCPRNGLDANDPANVKRCKDLLHRYVDADPKDWRDFAIGTSCVHYDEKQAVVEKWLRERPGRVFVYVAEELNMGPNYLLESRKSITEQSEREECDMRLRNYVADELLDDVFLRGTFQVRARFARRFLDDWERNGAPRWNAVLAPVLGNGDDKLVEPFKNVIEELKSLGYGSEQIKDADARMTQWGVFAERGFDPERGSAQKFGWDDDDSDVTVTELFPEAPVGNNDFLREAVDEALAKMWSDDDQKTEPVFLTRYRQRFESGDDKREIAELRERFFEKSKFEGEPAWTSALPTEGVSSSAFALRPLGETKTLLSLGDRPIVLERRYGESRLLIVDSACYFTNFGLLDESDRALAARIACEIPKKSDVAFVDGFFGGFSESNKIETKHERGKFSLAIPSPYTVFVWHAFTIAVLIAFACYPILGRPKRLRQERVNDFELHVDAVAEELESIGAQKWTQEQLDAYRDADKLPEL